MNAHTWRSALVASVLSTTGIVSTAMGEAAFDSIMTMSLEITTDEVPNLVGETALIVGDPGNLVGVAGTSTIFLDVIDNTHTASMTTSLAGNAEWNGIAIEPAVTAGVEVNTTMIELVNSDLIPRDGVIRVTFDEAALNASVDSLSGEKATASLRFHVVADTRLTGVPVGYLFSEDIETTTTVGTVSMPLTPGPIDIPFTIPAFGSGGPLAYRIWLVAQAGGSAASAFDGINVFTDTLPDPTIPNFSPDEHLEVIPEPATLALMAPLLWLRLRRD